MSIWREDQRFASQAPGCSGIHDDTLTEYSPGSFRKDHSQISLSVPQEQMRTLLSNSLMCSLPTATPPLIQTITMGGMELVRAEVIRGKFRNSFEKPEPFAPGKIISSKI